MKKQICPYCERKVSTINVWMRKDDKYTCPKCDKDSKIIYSDTLEKMAKVLIALMLCFTVVYIVFADGSSILGFCIVTMFFTTFYFLIPYFIKLKKTTK